MALCFQSICSGSSGNCLLLWTGRTRLLVDAGFGSMRKCRAALEDLLPDVDGVVVSHLHGDHVGYSSLRVMEEAEVPVHIHEGDIDLLGARHFGNWPFHELDIRPFSARCFRVGDFAVKPFEVPHHPGRTTFGFEVSCMHRGRRRKVVIASDLSDWRDLRPWFEDADFLYVEANHDPVLLRENPNFNSRYHLSNHQCGWLLADVLDNSETFPAAVMLGHLSDIRNTPDLAEETVWGILDEAGYGDVDLHVAPRYEPSEPIRIAR